MREPCWLSIAELARGYRERRFSAEGITRACLERIARLEPTLNAFIAVTADLALAQARRADEEFKAGHWRGPLHGVPVALKDLIDVAGVATTAASRVLQSNVAVANAELVTRLQDAGAIIIGKNNLHEFAYGGSGVVSAHGPSRNPWDTARITGGSSSGSAAAVAAGCCYAAIGSDTAGSIRLPAAMCGVVGLKPTYGAVSLRGVVPLSPSLDHVGPITRTVGDARLVFEAMRDGAANASNGPVRLGVARAYFTDGVQPDVQQAFESAVAVAARFLGGEAVDVDVPVDDNRDLQKGESYQVHRQYLANPELYDPETLRRIRTGEDIAVERIVEFRLALEEFRRASLRVFDRVDVIATPATPLVAPRLEDLQGKPELRPAEILMLRNTRPFNVLGWPAISVPCGLSSEGMPVGLQLAAAPANESMLLSVAERFEAAAGFHFVPTPLRSGA